MSKLYCKSLVLFLALAPSIVLAQVAPVFGDLGEPAWSRMYKFVEQKLGSGAPDDLVMILPTATNASWNDPMKAIRFMEMYRWGDQMPPNGWQYSPDASKRVSDGYGYFLKTALLYYVARNGTLTQPVKDALTRSGEELLYSRGIYNQTVADSDAAYIAYVASKPRVRKTKQQYFAEQALDKQIDAVYGRLKRAADTFTLLSSQIVDPDMDLLQQAFAKYSNPQQKIYLPPVREVLNDPSLWQQYYTSYIDKDLAAFMRQSVPFDETVDESQANSSHFESEWHASLSVKFLGFIRAGGADASQQDSEDHVRNNTTKIIVHYDNIDTFNITRGEWYSANVLDRFATQLPPDAFKTIFGPNGQLEIIPKALLVGRGLKFSIYADSNSLDYVYHHFQASADAGIRVGWFTVGGGGGYSETRSNTKINKFSDHIEIVDNSGKAKVIAVLGRRLGASTPHMLFALNRADLVPAGLPAASQKVSLQWSPSEVSAAQTSGMTPAEKARFVRPAGK